MKIWNLYGSTTYVYFSQRFVIFISIQYTKTTPTFAFEIWNHFEAHLNFKTFWAKKEIVKFLSSFAVNVCFGLALCMYHRKRPLLQKMRPCSALGVGPSLNFQTRAELEPRPVEPEPSLELIFEKNFEPEPSFEPKYLEPSPSPSISSRARAELSSLKMEKFFQNLENFRHTVMDKSCFTSLLVKLLTNL